MSAQIKKDIVFDIYIMLDNDTDIRGYLIATNKRCLIVSGNLDFQQNFRYQSHDTKYDNTFDAIYYKKLDIKT